MHCQGPKPEFGRGVTIIMRIESKITSEGSQRPRSVEREVEVTYSRSNDGVHREVPETDAGEEERGRVTPLVPPPQGHGARPGRPQPHRKGGKKSKSHIWQRTGELVRSDRQNALGRTGERHMTLVPDALRVCHEALTIRPVMD